MPSARVQTTPATGERTAAGGQGSGGSPILAGGTLSTEVGAAFCISHVVVGSTVWMFTDRTNSLEVLLCVEPAALCNMLNVMV